MTCLPFRGPAGWSVSQGLVVIDSSTGAATPLVADVGGALMQSLAFRQDGSAFGVSLINFWSVDLTTGSTTRIGGNFPGASLRGLAFVPAGRTSSGASGGAPRSSEIAT